MNNSIIQAYKNGYKIRKFDNKYYVEHRLIYKLCFGNIPKGWIIHHIDNNKINNKPENLLALPVYLHGIIHGPFKNKFESLLKTKLTFNDLIKSNFLWNYKKKYRDRINDMLKQDIPTLLGHISAEPLISPEYLASIINRYDKVGRLMIKNKKQTKKAIFVPKPVKQSKTVIRRRGKNISYVPVLKHTTVISDK